MLQSNGWSLADDSFVESVLVRVTARFPNQPEAVTDEAIRRATTHAYCLLLYEAFNNDGSDEQERAIVEVFRYVYRAVRAKTRGDDRLAEECANTATAKAWEYRSRVTEPGAFLSYVLTIGLREAQAALKDDPRETSIEESEMEGEREDGKPLEPAFRVEGVEGEVEESDQVRRIAQAIANCLKRREEITLIIENVLLETSFMELSQLLGKTPPQLHLIKFRALKKLERCEEFSELAREWRELSGEKP